MNLSGYTVTGELESAFARTGRRALLAGSAGAVLCLVGLLIDPLQFLRSYLVAYIFVLGIALGCMALAMVHHLSGGSWGLVIRRVLEASMGTIPLLAVLFLPIVLGIPKLYPWANADVVAHDAVLRHKSPYLNLPFFIARVIFYFCGWYVFAYFLKKWSLEQDRTGGARMSRRMHALSAPGLLFYGLSVTFAAVDWIMSLNADWFSTIFGILVMGGQALSAMAFVIAVTVILAQREPLKNAVSSTNLHDLGKFLFAFVMLWAYFSFSQFLIIWSGNLPEEIPWYLTRLRGGWQWIGLMLVVLHFALPFGLLLSRDLKRNGRSLIRVAIMLLVIRWVDVFWLIAPTFHPQGLRVHWMDLATVVAVAGIWLAYFLRQLKSRPLLPVGDPELEEVFAHE
jgi:hypothetical protein